MKKRVLVLAPHPDDEALGCGGALLHHAAAGHATRTIFLTSGEKGCRGVPEAETAQNREQEAAAAAKILGLESIEFWRLPDGAVRAGAASVARLQNTLAAWKPSVLYLTHPGERHPDHLAATRLGIRAARAAALPDLQILTYEVWTPLQKIAHVEDISDVIDRKMEAIRAHASQCAIMRFDEAALGLNRYRGEMHSWPGGPYAEVFGTIAL